MNQRDGDLPGASSRLLVAGDTHPVIVHNLSSSNAILLLGDHAGRAIPAKLGDLGVGAADLERHIAWDIGVAGLGAVLSEALDAAFIRQAYSRLVIDCNRTPGAAGSMVDQSDGSPVPGNLALSADQAGVRVREIFTPYHDAIAAALDARASRGLKTVLVSLHSFTPSMGGVRRPWSYGVLHRNDAPYARAVLAALRAGFGEAVGDNQPYAMDGTDFTIPHHVDPRGLDYLELEVRQDLLLTAAMQRDVAAMLAPLLTQALSV